MERPPEVVRRNGGRFRGIRSQNDASANAISDVANFLSRCTVILIIFTDIEIILALHVYFFNILFPSVEILHQIKSDEIPRAALSERPQTRERCSPQQPRRPSGCHSASAAPCEARLPAPHSAARPHPRLIGASQGVTHGGADGPLRAMILFRR